MHLKDNTTIVLFTINPNKYKGEFGFDWCEWDLENESIQKFQDIRTSDIEYVFDNKKQQYIPATNINTQKILKSLYPTKIIGFKKQYYTAWMNLSKGTKALLQLTTIYVNDPKKSKKEYITFKHNPDYDIQYNGLLNNAIKIPLSNNSKATHNIEIIAKNETKSKSYIEAIDEKENVLGIIEMNPNKKVHLDVKIIPIVMKSTNAKEKNEAIALYNKAIKARTIGLGNNLSETFNKHSFNQAGITCNIESIKNQPEIITIDLNSNLWDNYYDKENEKLKDWEFDPTEVNPDKRPSIWVNEDGETVYEYKNGKTENKKRTVLDQIEDVYYKKYGRDFKGALIFVTEESYFKPNIAGYSQTIPLRNQGTIIFKEGLNDSDIYAHELGHMLGLTHVFINDNKELEKINSRISSINNFIHITKAYIKKEQLKYDNDICFKKNKRNSYYNDFIKDIKKKKNKSNYEKNELKKDCTYLKNLDKEIQETEELKRKFINKYNSLIDEQSRKININHPVRIKQNTSNNYMDYYNYRLCFHRFQTLIMLEEIKDFY